MIVSIDISKAMVKKYQKPLHLVNSSVPSTFSSNPGAFFSFLFLFRPVRVHVIFHDP